MKTISAFLTAFMSLIFISPAYALLNVAWVAGNGADIATCGVILTPCKTFQYVHNTIIAPLVARFTYVPQVTLVRL